MRTIHFLALAAIAAMTACVADAGSPDSDGHHALDRAEDHVAPDAPVLDPPTSPTSLDHQRIRGSAEAGATVVIRGGLEEVTAVCDDAGRFEADVALDVGASASATTELSAIAIDAAGNVSAEARAEIRFDASIAIEAPRLDSVPTPSGDTTVTLTGTAEAGLEIHVEGGLLDAAGVCDADGRFAIDVMLHANTVNELRVTARSRITGDVSVAATIRVEHDGLAPAAPHLDPIHTPALDTRITVTGRAEARAEVRIEGGVRDVITRCDELGRFSAQIDLHAETTTHLSAVAIDLAGNVSAAASLSIAHRVELEAAGISLDARSALTAEASIVLTGRASVGARIEVTGGLRTVTGECDDAGAFRIEVALRLDARNELRVRDLATGSVAVAVIVHDGTAPPAPIASRIELDAGLVVSVCPLRTPVTVRGRLAVEAGALVRVRNHDTGVSVDTFAAADASFVAAIPACGGERLEIVAIDAAGNVGASAMIAVR